ncbi:MAG: DUF4091 domain-containing protein [Clostridia bacterium]|nr:DUF4091 domain-containing protein [Clostridia bacterium]
MKRIATIVISIVLLAILCTSVLAGASETATDPSQVYEPQIAPYEDASIDMWFEHSFKKVMTSDVTPSGMETYSVYMGKNEIENAQFVLYSEETKTRLRATVSQFTDESGNTIDAEIYYQMYVNLHDLNTLNIVGATADNTFIREGEQPDPMIPLSEINFFQLNAGKSQAFYIRLKSTEDTASGWYSAKLDIKNAKNQIVKTATVYAYVWDFTISEKTELKTAFYINNTNNDYKDYYDYLLENRIVGMDVPGDLNSTNPYLTNERVSAIRVSAVNGGNERKYIDEPDLYKNYAEIYNDLSSMKEWDAIKDKFYFYTLDECLHPQYGGTGSVDDVKARAARLDNYWENAAKVVPYHINHLYPYSTSIYNKPLASMDPSILKDATQELIDSGAVTIWCPRYYGYTPLSEINKYSYSITDDSRPIRNLSGTSSGNFLAGEWAFMWENIFGDYKDRIYSNTIIRNSQGNNDQMWIYSAGNNGGYTYPNHLIENTGLQTKMLFWQMYRDDITGYLYYGVNFWDEYDDINGEYVDATVTGNKTGKWRTNKRTNYPYSDGHSVYGNGVILYGGSQSGFTNLDYVGTVRVEMMRDGIEEYQMFKMLEEQRGNKASYSIIDTVFVNMANYLSLPSFNRSGLDSTVDDYTIMAETRIRLGNELEAAMADTCDHVYGEAKVIKKAQCLVMGEKVYKCTKCGAEHMEYIPTLHAQGDCFKVTEVTKSGCTSEGKNMYSCTVCGYVKYKTVAAYHTDPAHYKYEPHSVMTGVHKIICDVCNEELRTESHYNLAEYTNTCTDAGEHNNKCKYCGYTTKVADVEAKGHYLVETYKAPTCKEEGHKGAECYNCDYTEAEVLEIIDHNYVDGKCTMCGESDGSVSATPGDVDGDGEVTMLDLFALKLFIKQKDIPTDAEVAAGDIDGDGEITMVDSFELKYRISTGYWRQ